ncbi:hypothetical protein BDF20DRAFT_881060 [Mycotypha africana]|uniref:uncharacterized protein n=1 Tax=Mycotypha africana TaxID=64632 RepID=UPI0023016AAF|nr:uncharacterized protein BDF20DRAFT_881060 [Mycotypha africana]KAI8973215.1 hypothetical protein BDF20DRAFT_881060 [Mycotypha africana]
MNGGPSITPASNFATIPLQLQPLPSSTELPKSIATSLSIASSHLHSESKTRSLSTSDEDEMERTREFFQVFEPDGFNLTLVEQQLFMYDLPDNNRVFGQELEEGLLRHVNLIESDSEAEDFGSPLAHYLNKLLVPPIADKGSVFVRNKIDVDVGTISDNDEASLTDISRRIICNILKRIVTVNNLHRPYPILNFSTIIIRVKSSSTTKRKVRYKI